MWVSLNNRVGGKDIKDPFCYHGSWTSNLNRREGMIIPDFDFITTLMNISKGLISSHILRSNSEYNTSHHSEAKFPAL